MKVVIAPDRVANDASLSSRRFEVQPRKQNCQRFAVAAADKIVVTNGAAHHVGQLFDQLFDVRLPDPRDQRRQFVDANQEQAAFAAGRSARLQQRAQVRLRMPTSIGELGVGIDRRPAARSRS